MDNNDIQQVNMQAREEGKKCSMQNVINKLCILVRRRLGEKTYVSSWIASIHAFISSLNYHPALTWLSDLHGLASG